MLFLPSQYLDHLLLLLSQGRPGVTLAPAFGLPLPAPELRKGGQGELGCRGSCGGAAQGRCEGRGTCLEAQSQSRKPPLRHKPGAFPSPPKPWGEARSSAGRGQVEAAAAGLRAPARWASPGALRGEAAGAGPAARPWASPPAPASWLLAVPGSERGLQEVTQARTAGGAGPR